MFKKAPKGFLAARDLGTNVARALKRSTCKRNKAARYDRTTRCVKNSLHNTVFM